MDHFKVETILFPALNVQQTTIFLDLEQINCSYQLLHINDFAGRIPHPSATSVFLVPCF